MPAWRGEEGLVTTQRVHCSIHSRPRGWHAASRDVVQLCPARGHTCHSFCQRDAEGVCVHVGGGDAELPAALQSMAPWRGGGAVGARVWQTARHSPCTNPRKQQVKSLTRPKPLTTVPRRRSTGCMGMVSPMRSAQCDQSGGRAGQHENWGAACAANWSHCRPQPASLLHAAAWHWHRPTPHSPNTSTSTRATAHLGRAAGRTSRAGSRAGWAAG